MKQASAMSWIALLVVWIVWGSTYLGMAAAVQSMPPFLMAGARFALAGPLLFAVTWPRFRRQGGRLLPAQIRAAVAIGILLFLGGNGMVCLAETRIDSGFAALINAVTPVWMAGMTAGITRVAPTRRTIVAFAMGVVGILVMVGAPGGDVALAYALLMIVASVCWAAGTVASRYVSMPDNPFVNSSIQMVGGGIALLLAGTMLGEWNGFALDAVSRTSWYGFGWLFVAGSLVAYSAYVYANQTLPIDVVGTYAYVNPVIAVILGAMLLDEPVGPNVILGGAIILLAVVVIVSGRRRQSRRRA